MSATQTPAARGGGRPGRGYYLEDGTRVPAVTTIGNRFDDKSALVKAANNVGLEGKTLEEAWYGARGIGHEVHAMVEAYLHAESVPPASTLEAVNGFESFVEWWEAGKFTVEYTELPIISETMRYGGTIDTILRDSKGRLCLGDWKTSSGIFPGYLVQVSAYAMLFEEWSGEKLDGGFHLARFSKDHGDFEHRHYAELDDARELFLLYRQAYDIDKRVAKRAR